MVRSLPAVGRRVVLIGGTTGFGVKGVGSFDQERALELDLTTLFIFQLVENYLLFN